MTDQTKRWSAAVVCREESRVPPKVHPMIECHPPETNTVSPTHSLMSSHHFQRHTNRLSMQFSGPGYVFKISGILKFLNVHITSYIFNRPED